jgi:hypothetical protein
MVSLEQRGEKGLVWIGPLPDLYVLETGREKLMEIAAEK